MEVRNGVTARRQDKSGRRPLDLVGDASICLHIGFGDGAWLAREGAVLALTQKSDRHQSSERQPAYSVVLKDRFGQSKP